MNYFVKLIIISIGSIIAGAGTAISIGAGFGCATLAVMWQGLSMKLAITVGQASLLVAFIMFLFILWYDREQIHIGTLIHMILYSISLDIFGILDVQTEILPLDVIIMLLGIILFGIGVGLYAAAEFGKGPYESITFAISKKKGWHIKYVRSVLDGVFIVIGYLLGGQVGICTIATMVMSGYIIEKTYALLCFRDNTKKRALLKSK